MITPVVLWLLVAEAVSWPAFALLRPIFRGWPDEGLGASKAAGVVLLGLVTWLASWAGLAPSPALAWAAALAILAAGTVAMRRRAVLPRHAGLVELTWLLTFAAFLAMRAAAPAIAGGEKLMDSAMLGASMRAETMPPVDPWLSGFGINYYFFGYAMWAQVARLCGAPLAVAYNLAMATVPAMVAATALSIGLRLCANRTLALVSSVTLTWCGTLAGARVIGTIGPAFDYWGPSRVIDGTINEFPFFTFMWGDLHPHAMAMPVFLLAVALCLAWAESGTSATAGTRAAAMGAVAGASTATSAWDAVPLTLLVACSWIAARRRFDARSTLVSAAAAIAAAAVVALPPMLATPGTPVHIGLATRHSAVGQWLLVQGGWWLPLVAAAAASAAVVRRVRIPAWPLAVTALGMVILSELVFVDDVYGPELQRMNTVFKFHLHAMLLLGVAWPASLDVLRRLPSVASSSMARAATASAWAAIALGLAAAMAYPAGVVSWRWSTRARPLSLDGTAYLEAGHAGDRAAIAYLDEHVSGQPVIAEAPGGQYDYAGRVSGHTGLSAVLGWAGHERLWRRGEAAANEIAERQGDLAALYEGPSEAVRALAAKYHIAFIVVGDAERAAYPALDEAAIASAATPVFTSGTTRVYEVAR